MRRMAYNHLSHFEAIPSSPACHAAEGGSSISLPMDALPPPVRTRREKPAGDVVAIALVKKTQGSQQQPDTAQRRRFVCWAARQVG